MTAWQFLMLGDVNSVDLAGETPLHMAVKYRNSNTMSALLASGANKEFRDSQGSTALHLATQVGDVGAVLQLLEQARVRNEATGYKHGADGAGISWPGCKRVQGAEVAARNARGERPIDLTTLPQMVMQLKR
jgi:hypothetical protein